MNIPTPEWMKPMLVPAAPAETSVPVVEPEQEAIETDVPEDVQVEVRELAAQEQAALATTPPEVVEMPEGLEHGSGDRDEAPDGFDDEPEAESPVEFSDEPPRPSRTPRCFDIGVRALALKAFLAQVGHLVDEAKATVGRDGVRVVCVDPAHVALVDVTLADQIDVVQRTENASAGLTDSVIVGVDVAKLTALLKQAKRDDVVHVRFGLPDDEDGDRITVSFGTLKRTMASLDTADMADPKVPALNLPIRIRAEGKALYEAMKAAAEVSDHVRLTATQDGLNVTAQGEVDTVSIDLRDGAGVEVVWNGSDERHSSLFPLDYLVSFLRTVKDEALTMHLGTDYPIRIQWTGTTAGTFLLAPRLESA